MAKKEKKEVAQPEEKKEDPEAPAVEVKEKPKAKKAKEAPPKKVETPSEEPKEEAPEPKEEVPPPEEPKKEEAPPKEPPKKKGKAAPPKKEEAPAEEPKEEEAPPVEPVKEKVEEAPVEEPKEAPPEKEEVPADEPKVAPPEEPKVEEAPPAVAEKAEETPLERPKEEAPPKRAPRKPTPPEDVPLLFDMYDFTEVEVADLGLKRYINLIPIVIPHTGAKHANRRFGRMKVNIVERLINNTMRTEKFTGKKSKAYSTVKKAFEIIKKKSKKNPIQMLVNALENAAPREEITRLRFGGISVPRAVDIAPSRRLDIAIRNICKGAVASSHKNRKSIENCLADEILMAANEDMNSFSISKKEELERIAVSAR